MISEKIFKILLMGLMIGFLIGCSPSSYAQRYKSHSKKKSKTSVQVSKKRSSKNSKKKSSSKKSRYSPKKETVVKDTSDYAPDDLLNDEEDGEDLPTEKEMVNVSQLVEKYVTNNKDSEPSDSVNHKEKIIMEIIKYLDTPYKFGGNTNKGIDCSAFTKAVFGNSFSVELPRTAREQFQLGDEINDMSELKFGDLIFFNTRRRVKPGHVGIYIGDRLFAHSSSKQGVMVSSLDTEYYAKKFMGGRRVENQNIK